MRRRSAAMRAPGDGPSPRSGGKSIRRGASNEESMSRTLLVLILLVAPALADDVPWATHRGNARRTGNTDNVPGPAKPMVLWSLKSTMNYFSSPVPNGNELILPGLRAGFNDGNLLSYPIAPKDPNVLAPTWSKGGLVLKLPTVSS